MAAEEILLLKQAFGACLINVHHIGSTAIPGIRAKPVLDLMPVVFSLPELDNVRPRIEALNYEWWGEFGLPGRRYCTKTDPATMRRAVQLHCYAKGSLEIVRHLAFRDYLLKHDDVALTYDLEKSRCQALYPDNSHSYGDCKAEWINTVEADALAHYSGCVF